MINYFHILKMVIKMNYLKKRLRALGLLIMILVVSVIMLQPTMDAPVFQNKKYVALTYDDGPSQISTKKLLDLLERYDAKATFFVTGVNANSNKELVKEIVDRGNEVGNHTLDHVWLTKTDEKEMKRQIYGNENLLKFLTDQKGDMLIRPPYGAINDEIMNAIQLPFIMWSVDSRDWEIKDVIKIQSNVMRNVEDGDIIIMHDGYETTIEASENVLIDLQKQGFEIVTVSELFAIKNKEIPLHEKVKSCRSN